MSGLLEQLGFKKRIHVGISLSMNNFIELVCINNATKSVSRYASGNVKYNSAIREIIDFDEFSEVVEDLFEEVGLNPQECSVTLSLPNIHFGIVPMEEGSDSAAYIIENLQDEIEDLYIFKRSEPIITWATLNGQNPKSQKNVVFSAIQSKVIGKLIDIFDNLQVDLKRIETSNTSILKALQYSNRFSKYLAKGQKSTIIYISNMSCSTFHMNENNITAFEEEPIAIKSFSPEEVYASIIKIAENAISARNNVNSLIIISETDEVNAELISSKLDFKGNIECIDKITKSEEPLIEVSGYDGDIDENMLQYMTLDAIGAAAADFEDFPLDLNFVPADRIDPNVIFVGQYEINFTRFVLTLLIAAILIAVLIGFLIKSIFVGSTNQITNGTMSVDNEIKVFDKKTKDINKKSNKAIFPVIKQVVENNKDIVEVFNALSTEIPDGIYIKRFISDNSGGIGIIGEAKTAESVSSFVSGLKEKNEDLELAKLSVNTKFDDIPGKINNGFTFEIKTPNIQINMVDDEFGVNTPANPTTSPALSPKKNSSTRYSTSPSSSSYNPLTPPPPLI